MFFVFSLPAVWASDAPKKQLEEPVTLSENTSSEVYGASKGEMILQSQISQPGPLKRLGTLLTHLKQNRAQIRAALKLAGEHKKSSSHSAYRNNGPTLEELEFEIGLLRAESNEIYKKIFSTSCELPLLPGKKLGETVKKFLCPGFWPFC